MCFIVLNIRSNQSSSIFRSNWSYSILCICNRNNIIHNYHLENKPKNDFLSF
nr:MAG TPA: hypothetical protein [Caudoviricetes sp.]